ncbi:MAG: CBS domain-containing protein [Gammaproteobacteria bacterium]|nr:CBS domain-containing protein [Gammaproteobacteria bacterium]
MKTVRDVLNHTGATSVHSVSPIATVYEAIESMSERHVGALPVLQDNTLVGIISERDYARKVILKDRSSKNTRVSEIMTQDVVTVDREHTVDACINLMKSHHIRHLVVVEEGRVTGMLSLRDLFTEIIDEQAQTIDQLEHYIQGQ